MYTTQSCPECDGQLHKEPTGWLCDACHHHFKQYVHCNDCDALLEPMQACGAVDFFCQHCNELKSKSRVLRRFDKLL